MKYLTDFTEPLMSELFKNNGVFFAFNQQQYDESAQPNVKYSKIIGGGYVPTENREKLDTEMDNVIANGIKQDKQYHEEYAKSLYNQNPIDGIDYDDAVKNHGVKNGAYLIINRQLCNYEAFYSFDSFKTVKSSLRGYGYSDELISDVYQKEAAKRMDW